MSLVVVVNDTARATRFFKSRPIDSAAVEGSSSNSGLTPSVSTTSVFVMRLASLWPSCKIAGSSETVVCSCVSLILLLKQTKSCKHAKQALKRSLSLTALVRTQKDGETAPLKKARNQRHSKKEDSSSTGNTHRHSKKKESSITHRRRATCSTQKGVVKTNTHPKVVKKHITKRKKGEHAQPGKRQYSTDKKNKESSMQKDGGRSVAVCLSVVTKIDQPGQHVCHRSLATPMLQVSSRTSHVPIPSANRRAIRLHPRTPDRQRVSLRGYPPHDGGTSMVMTVQSRIHDQLQHC